MTRQVVVRTLLVVVGVLVVLVGVLPVPAQAAGPAMIERDGEPITVTLNGRTQVGAGEVVDDVWVANGRARIDGRVEGSVIVLNGGATVSGSVGGDVMVVRGDLSIGPQAIVEGEARASEPITVAEGAVIEGGVQQWSVLGGLEALAGRLRTPIWVGLTVALVALGLAALRPAGDLIDRSRAQLRARPMGSTARGLAVLVGLPVIALLALATVVGGVLAGLLLSGAALAAVAGLIVAAVTVGHRVVGGRSAVLGFLVGALILRLVALVPYIGLPVTVAATLCGTGALLAALLSLRSADDRRPASDQADERLLTAGVGSGPGAGASVNLDLRPGHTQASMFDDPAARVNGGSAPSWLDDIVAGTRGSDHPTEAVEPVLDLRDDPPAVEPEPSATARPEIIAALPVREDRFADDPDGPVGNGARLELFADAPRARPEGLARPLPTEPTGEDGREPAAPGPDDPLGAEPDATRIPAHQPGAVRREHLLTDRNEDETGGGVAPGGLFPDDGRAWRPHPN